MKHRDLHENNICVAVKSDPKAHPEDPNNSVRFGYSGLEVTIIDYGLSRARLENGDTVFLDLEKDMELFRGDETGAAAMQFDNYRRLVPLPRFKLRLPESDPDTNFRTLACGAIFLLVNI